MLPSVSMIQTVSTNPPLTSNKFQNQFIPTLNSPSLSTNRANHRPRRISATSSVLDEPNGRTEAKEKLRVVVKPVERPRLVLKFIWMEKNIGIALDQFIPGGHGTIPLSPYYLWPRKDAWEELKIMLESKAWISQKQMVILLNQATDIINLWQQNGGG